MAGAKKPQERKRNGGHTRLGGPPFPHRLSGARGFTPAVLLPPAAAGTGSSTVRRVEELRHRSPNGLAGPQGSPMRALRVGSGRGPTLRTALRGATSERVEHATGSICPGRVITRITDAWDERAPPTSPLPNRPNCRRVEAAPERSRRNATHHQDREVEKSRKCLIFFGLRCVCVGECGGASQCN